MTRNQTLGMRLIWVGIPFAVGGLYWWPFSVVALFSMYFGFMMVCFS